MLRPLKVPSTLGLMGGEKVIERIVEVRWPTRAVPVKEKQTRSSEFHDLMAFHRPVYTQGGHKGPTTKQRIGNRRQAWRRRFQK